MKKNVLLNFFYVYNILHFFRDGAQQDKAKSSGLHQEKKGGGHNIPQGGIGLSVLIMYYSRTFIEKLTVK